MSCRRANPLVLVFPDPGSIRWRGQRLPAASQRLAMNHPARPTRPASLSGLIHALPLAALLAACGGGESGGGSPSPSPAPNQPPAEITRPISGMPTSSYTGDKLAAFERLNEARLAAGVGAVRQNAELDAAAQAHATYQVRNYTVGHGEDPNRPWFTGTNHAARAAAQGYTGQIVVEVITYVPPGTETIESFLHSVYHLHGILEPRANQAGLGVDRTTTPGVLNSTSITLGTTDLNLLSIEPTWHWPTNGQIDVNPRFVPASESPNPAPDLAVTGTPIMFCGSKGRYAPLRLVRATVKDARTLDKIPLRLLRYVGVTVDDGIDAQVVTDANLGTVHQGCVFLLPSVELEHGETYEVDIQAIQAGESIGKTWTFSTLNSH